MKFSVEMYDIKVSAEVSDGYDIEQLSDRLISIIKILSYPGTVVVDGFRSAIDNFIGEANYIIKNEQED
jgi:hypothetical protein